MNSIEQISAESQNITNSSVCGKIMLPDSKKPTGFSVTLDENEAQPIYFNRFGYIDPSLHKTSANGRFCVLNLSPGPVFMVIKKRGRAKSQKSYCRLFPAIIARPFKLTKKSTVNAQIKLEGARGAPQLDSPTSRIEEIKNIELSSLGENDTFVRSGDHFMSPKKVFLFNGKSFFIAKNLDLEPAIFTFDSFTSNSEISLFTKGYIRNSAFRAGLSPDPTLGSIVVDMRRSAHKREVAEVQLITANGNPHEEHYHEVKDNEHRTIFFNVKSGLHLIKVQMPSGKSLLKTALVYDETLSYLRIGTSEQRLASKPLKNAKTSALSTNIIK